MFVTSLIRSRTGILYLNLWLFFSIWTASAAPTVTATAAVVYDPLSQQCIYNKNMDLPMYPASTVKLLTAMIALDRWSLSKKIKIPRSVEKICPYKLYLKKNDVYSLEEMLNALLIRSANDVAHTLAINYAGSERRFAVIMNKKAWSIGARHSYFTNPHGLPNSKQLVTARDMALLVEYTMRYPAITKIMGKRFYQFHKKHNTKSVELITRNRLLLDHFKPVVLGKTGYTNKAGRCFAGYIDDPAHPMIIVIFQSKNRWGDVRKLAVWANQFYHSCIQRNKKLLGKTPVSLLQEKLFSLGFYYGKVDNLFGRQTEAAVLRFQNKQGLKVNGILNNISLDLLGLN
ncbi:MAG: peptidoglycan-binding protein [Candidatus Aureabacteria bacterium]|nr:peptidoglycan-binding protein [Candidatus Auribacterota bacterium]